MLCKKKRKRIESIPCKVHDPGYSLRTMNDTQLSSEDYSLLVEASADERQMQNFFSPDVEESEGDNEEWGGILPPAENWRSKYSWLLDSTGEE
jgi:hypothetical protein